MDSVVARVYYMNMYVVFSSVLTAKNILTSSRYTHISPSWSYLLTFAQVEKGPCVP